jgi:hypothetical protein
VVGRAARWSAADDRDLELPFVSPQQVRLPTGNNSGRSVDHSPATSRALATHSTLRVGGVAMADTDTPAEVEGVDRSPSWFDLVDAFLDESADRDEVVELTTEDLRVEIPIAFGEGSPRADWRFDGTVRVSTDAQSGPLLEWLRWWYRQSREE